MDLVATYSSDDSDNDRRDSCESHTPSIPTNYFNLQADDSDENITKSEENLKDFYSYNVSLEAHTLSQESYGPKLEAKCPFDESSSPCKSRNNTKNNKRKTSSPSRTCHYSYNSKSLKTEQIEGNKSETNYSKYFKQPTTFAEDFNDDDKGKMATTETDLYYQDYKITSKAISNHTSSLPKHQSKFFNGHDSAVSSLSWCISQFSHLFMTSSFDSSIKLWDINKSDCMKHLETVGPVKAAKWSLCGRSIIYGGFNKKAVIVDIDSGKTVVDYGIGANVSSIEQHPLLENIFLVGTQDNIYAFDTREVPLPIKCFSSNCKYVLDIAFINENKEFVCSTELVSRDSSDKTIMVWDFASGALLSNQIYSERYTCPCIRVQPGGNYFAAQSNGDYLVMFSTKRPYKRQNKRFSGHKVSGYGIGCDFSNDGKYLVSGDADGGLYIYSSLTSDLIKKIDTNPGVPVVKVAWHSVLSSTVAMAGWDGSVQIWN